MFSTLLREGGQFSRRYAEARSVSLPGNRAGTARPRNGQGTGIPAWLFLLAACASGLLAACASGPGLYPDMTPEASAVRVHFGDAEPECDETLELGNILAVAGKPSAPYKPSPQVDFELAMQWLKYEAAKKGATDVVLIEHRGNPEGTVHTALGKALFCRINPR